MSLFGALSSGVSGLSAQSSALVAIADNVTNVNTVGYKSTDVQFQTLVTAQVSTTQYSPGGVQSSPQTQVDAQGLLQASTSATDLAISGQGFYVVNEQPTAANGSLFAYTRAGSFSIDKDGFLSNTAGWYLQGWPLQSAGSNTTGFSTVTVGSDTFVKAYNDSNGDTVSINDNIVSNDDLQPLNLNTIGGTASETKNIRLGANLPAGDAIGDQSKTNVVVFDTLGNSTNLELVWEKDQENSWGLSLETPPGAATLEIHGTDSTDATPDVFAASGLLEFTGVPTDGEQIIITDGTGVPITFEFDTNSSVTQTATLRQIDISASTVASATDVTPLLTAAINASNLQGTSRFADNGTEVKITQSTMGDSIGVDVSNILTVNQVAANGNLGTFTIPPIDFAYKHGARIDFQTSSIAPTASNNITFTAGTDIISGISGTFTGWQIGDTISVSGTSSTGQNDGTFTITDVAANGASITLNSGNVVGTTTEDENTSVVVRNNNAPSEVYDNLDTVITPASTGTAITFRLHEPSQASASVAYNIDTNFVSENTVTSAAANNLVFTATSTTVGTIDAATATTFDNYAVGDTFRVAGSVTNAGNDGDYNVTAINTTTGTITVTKLSGTITAGTESNAATTGDQIRHRIAIPVTKNTVTDASLNNLTFTATSVTVGTVAAATAGTFDDYSIGDTFRVAGSVTNATNDGDYIISAIDAAGTTITVTKQTGGNLVTGTETNAATTGNLISGEFSSFTTGDAITITNAENTANNLSLSVIDTDNSTFIEFAPNATTTLATANTDDEDITITIDTDATGNIDYVDISSASTISGIVSQLAADINANTEIPTGTRFSGSGTSLIFEQSAIGDAINILMDSTTGDASTGLVTTEWVDPSTTTLEGSTSDGITMAMIETTFGSKESAISFNGDGTPSEFNVDNLDIQWANGASDQEFTSTAEDTRVGLFLGNTNVADGMTQFAGSFQINFISQNGAQFGNFAGVSVGDDGVVTALFDNGVTRPVFMVPVATFVNANGMNALSGNVFIETDNSGQPTVREAGEGGAGAVTGAALESSTVDLGEEFTAMIATQQAYSAAAKIITTADEMLDELLRIK